MCVSWHAHGHCIEFCKCCADHGSLIKEESTEFRGWYKVTYTRCMDRQQTPSLVGEPVPIKEPRHTLHCQISRIVEVFFKNKSLGDCIVVSNVLSHHGMFNRRTINEGSTSTLHQGIVNRGITHKNPSRQIRSRHDRKYNQTRQC
jgi:hypothetical protein